VAVGGLERQNLPDAEERASFEEDHLNERVYFELADASTNATAHSDAFGMRKNQESAQRIRPRISSKVRQ
jgi:hypothetical protein